ncbi:hypothetical protein NM688_g8574 [Phlebia brevispora]|uniref:Uncharacterized protein n=1 Tax=Phlebia brevispora TaxID=194682 RepID=A0ACC1RRF7_9APHY|nr:hypothetical protein NM688_g8574 [Phlebia brevispora]
MAIQTSGQGKNGQSVDVQSQLMQSRRRNRHPGQVPYPVQYDGKQATYDDWNYMFCKKVFGNPSMHNFATPPSKVLDLGCGTGLWVLDAAQQWTTSHFVGFDRLRIQPDLSRMSHGISDATRRIRWVHGNLLEPLPFAPETFDFVRISGIGLGVPEDEWQDLFQELARIMKPDAILEIMEDDLLFPCGNVAKPKDVRPVVPNQSPSEPASPPPTKSPKASHTSLPFPGSKSPTSHLHKSPARRPKPLEKESSSSTVGSNTSSSSILSSSAGSSSMTAPSLLASMEPEEIDFELVLDPRDHSKLKRAWDDMLEKRFLSSKLLAILPFYLSAEFMDVQIRTAVNVPLPPNTIYVPDDETSASASPTLFPTRQRSNTLQSISSVLEQSVTSTQEPPDPAELLAADCASNYRERSRSVTTSSWASMHLARTVNILQGCKEAIWDEYSKFGCPFVTQQSLNVTRAEFQAAWTDWERDMRNRMGMRANIPRFASWTALFSGDDPEWKAWRARKATWDVKDADAGVLASPKDELSMADATKPEETKEVPKETPRSTAEADFTKYKTAADIVSSTMKKLVELSVEGAKILDICIEGDKLIEQGTGAVYNKAVKGVKVPKGASRLMYYYAPALTQHTIFAIHRAHREKSRKFKYARLTVGGWRCQALRSLPACP